MAVDSSRRGPLLVIGLDGATFDLIGPMAERGELPTLARLMEQGAWGPLQSTTPPVSPQAWSSFLTGVGPGKHGVFGFLGPPRGRSYRRPVLSSGDIRQPTLLQIAGEAAHRVAAFGIPMTYPPGPLNGILVPEQHGPPLSFPPGIWEQLIAAIGDPRDVASHIPYLFTLDKRPYVEHQLGLVETQRRAVHWLMDQEHFDLLIAVFTASDRMNHFLWKYMDRNHPEHPRDWTDLLGDALPGIYRRLDAVIGELWERIGERGTILIVSDHGSGPLWKRFYANQWLRQNGYLSVRSFPFRLASVRYPWPVLRLLNAAARRIGLPYQDLPIKRWRGPIDPESYDPRFFFDAHLVIDWSKTRAYSGNGSEYGIFVNLRGREPRGIVNPGSEYDALVDELHHGLLSLHDPETGEAVVSRVWRQDEIYSGPYVQRAPDLVAEFTQHCYALSPDIFQANPLGTARLNSGTHRPEGIFLAAGRSVQPGRVSESMAIVDVAPTILYLLGIPIPEHMEGRVIEEAFFPIWRSHNPVRKTPFTGSYAEVDGEELSSKELAQIEAHLRSLGYIG